MKSLFTLTLFLFVIPNIILGNSISKQLAKGKVLIIEVTPIGDAFADPADWHRIDVFQTDRNYFIELYKDETSKKKEISEQKLNEIIAFIEKWQREKAGFFNGGLSYDRVKIKIGIKTKKFRSNFCSDQMLLDLFK